MKWFPIRRLATLLMVASAGGQTTTGSALLASALTLVLHAHDHAHSVSLVGDRGHLHLVLGHTEGTQPGHGSHGSSPDHRELPVSLAETEHVFHVTSDEATTSLARRPHSVPAAAPTIPVVLPVHPSGSGLRPAPEPHARGSDVLKSIVLRL